VRQTAFAAEYSGVPVKTAAKTSGRLARLRHHRRARVGLLVVAVALAALGFAVVATGLVDPPDLNAALTSLADTLGPWTYALVAGLAFLETGAFVGLIAPGETALVLGGVVAAKGEVDLPVILALTWAAAALGDFASFMLGRRLKHRFLERHGPRIGVNEPRLQRVDTFFARHGAKAILVGRFVGIVRAVAPFTAGASGMRLRGFVPWSLLGTAAWSSMLIGIGYAFHSSFEHATDLFTHGALGVALVVAALLALRAHRRAA
jgi:membrane-associated protein